MSPNRPYLRRTVTVILVIATLVGFVSVFAVWAKRQLLETSTYTETSTKLLENEDHLFDSGLYLGFLGTIISLILVSLGVFKQPSLMAAYSSTSFGILFVVLFKVVHLRPARRHLLLEADSESPIRVAPPVESTLAAPL